VQEERPRQVLVTPLVTIVTGKELR